MENQQLSEVNAELKVLKTMLDASQQDVKTWQAVAERNIQLAADAKQKLDAVVAENVALINYIDAECFTESKRTGVYTCAGINRPTSPETDAILNAVQAEGVEMFAAHQRAMIGKPNKNDAATSYAARCAVEYAAILLAGKDGE